MKRIIILGIVLASFIFAENVFAEQANNRYQIFSVNAPKSYTLLLDTKTGRVWKLKNLWISGEHNKWFEAEEPYFEETTTEGIYETQRYKQNQIISNKNN
jgi:hypothetical protein